MQLTTDTGTRRDTFAGPASVNVNANQEGSYLLKFTPPWIGTYTGTLVLLIPATQESSTYKLVGRGLEPAATDHIKLACVARGSKPLRLEVPNPVSKQMDFKVFTDLPYLSGQDNVTIGGKSSAKYDMTFCPAVSGSYAGTLTFSSKSGEYVWYTMEAQVAPAPHMETIRVSCPGARLFVALLHTAHCMLSLVPCLHAKATACVFQVQVHKLCCVHPAQHYQPCRIR